MQDIQSQLDTRGISLKYVGVKNLTLPFTIRIKPYNSQTVTASVNFYASLAHNTKGHHLSRFVEMIFGKNSTSLTYNKLKSLINEARVRLNAESVRVEIDFKFFLPKQSPVSKKWNLCAYSCSMICEGDNTGISNFLILEVPVLLLCPCSKAISRYNAHNQRALIRVKIALDKTVSIKEIVEMIEKKGSCELFPLLKRVDEKYVTEISYENPKFVEDAVRDVVLELKTIKEIQTITVECESYESIHAHDAYAIYE